MNSHHWRSYHQQKQQDPDAAEAGRLMTAHGMAVDHEGRKRMEDEYGIEFCRSQYPEAYHGNRPGIAKFLDAVRAKIKW